MLHIVTNDNNCGCCITDSDKVKLDNDFTKDNFNDLLYLSNKQLKDLLKDNNSLLIFPNILGEYNDGIEENCIFNLIGTDENLKTVTIETGNILGFIGYRNTKISIKSRFSKTSKEDYFMQYMLWKVLELNLIDLPNTVDINGSLDILYFLFPLFLKRALRQGVFKTYQGLQKNDSRIKGTIDVSRHIKCNMPFKGTVAYNCRERIYDNYLIELIRHTIEIIKIKSFGEKILSNDMEIKEDVSLICSLTQNYNIRDREYIISKNLKPLNHPYFTEYKKLQSLCIAILKYEKIKYDLNSSNIYGILFDGAWLWEEYLWTLLKKEEYNHPRNKEGSGGIRMFANNDVEGSFDKCYRKIYPDFYKKNTKIIDAKYKRLNSGVPREDLYQVVSYMHTMNILNGGYIYPSLNENEDKQYKLAGMGGILEIIGLGIPQNVSSFEEFLKSINMNENILQYKLN